jgi:hypothetical protein
VHGVEIASFAFTILGVLLTVLALGFAVAIYGRQTVEQMNFRTHVDKRFDALIVERIEKEELTGVSPNVEVSDPPRYVTRTIGDVSVVDPNDIPIAVIGDLWAAISTGEFGDHRGWLLGEVRAGYRRSGKGNHPWYVVLDDREQTDNTWIARLSRGGQGKSAPTVTLEEARSFFGIEDLPAAG